MYVYIYMCILSTADVFRGKFYVVCGTSRQMCIIKDAKIVKYKIKNAKHVDVEHGHNSLVIT